MNLTKHTTRSGTTHLAAMVPNWRFNSPLESGDGQEVRVSLGRNGRTNYGLTMSPKEAAQLGKMLVERFGKAAGERA